MSKRIRQVSPQRWCAAVAVAIGASMAVPAMAADFDGSKPLLCATGSAVTCTAQGECLRGSADMVNLPAFLKVDVAKKLVSDLAGTRSTEIMNTSTHEGDLILQGMQNGRAWSASINQESGVMTVSTTAQRTVHAVFGACTLQ